MNKTEVEEYYKKIEFNPNEFIDYCIKCDKKKIGKYYSFKYTYQFICNECRLGGL